MTGTVYLKTNLENAKAYVGQTWRFTQRQYEHNRESLRSALYPLHRAMRKYPFDTQVLAEVSSQEEMDNLERIWVAILQTNSREYGYNVGTPGKKGGESNRRGAKFNPEQLKRLSDAHKGQPGVWEGKKLSAAHREALRIARAKRTLRQRAEGYVSPCKGRTANEEARQHMREAQQARIKREKENGIVRTWKCSVPRSEESRQKMRDAWARNKALGIKWNLTEESKKRISDGLKKAYAEGRRTPRR